MARCVLIPETEVCYATPRVGGTARVLDFGTASLLAAVARPFVRPVKKGDVR